MCLQLKNNEFIRMDHFSYAKIEKEVKTKYPNIEIGCGIIDEESTE